MNLYWGVLAKMVRQEHKNDAVYFSIFCSYSSPSNESENPKFNKDNPEPWVVIGPSAFKKGAWGSASLSHAQFVFQGNTSHLSWQKQSHRRPLLLGCTNNVNGVTTMRVQTSFVHYMKRCVLLLYLTFCAACPTHNCSFSPHYASVFQNPPIVSG